MGFSQIIASAEKSDRHREYAGQITLECRRMTDLINQLLDLAKIEAGKMDIEKRAFSVASLVEDLPSSFKDNAAEKNLSLTINVNDNVPDVLVGDSMRLRQILMNLIGNSLKFTNEGSICLTINAAESSPEEATITFKVIDTGIGIPTDKLETIFDSFAQADGSTSRRFGGTGLGTAISKQLVELMGGEIGAESELGQGSTFWFTLTLEKGKIEKETKLPQVKTEQEIRMDGSRILVVEDYPTNQAIVRHYLESAGCDATVAENGEQGVEEYRNGHFDLVLMDVQMPKMDGHEATKAIRRLADGKDVPIVGMTANAYKRDRQRCSESGMNDCLSKPFERSQFLKTVKSWLDRDRKTEESHERLSELDEVDTSGSDVSGAPIDVDAFIERVGGNDSVAWKIINGFVAQLPIQLTNIENGIKDKDITIVDREAHSIKGGALNVCARDLMEESKKLETLTKANTLEGASRHLENIKHEYSKLKAYLEKGESDEKPGY